MVGRGISFAALARGAPATKLALGLHCHYVYPIGIYIEVTVTRSTVFKSNRSQAVRLPKPVAFPEGVRQVEIIKIGKSRLVSPVGKRWDDLFSRGPRASMDFMKERPQPTADEREPL